MDRYLVLGASPNPLRFSNKAVRSLLRRNRSVVPLGTRDGSISGIEILTGQPSLENIHTVLLYMSAERQRAYYDYILDLYPKRIIFNPGTENPEFEEMVKSKGIEVVVACAMVMISDGEI